MMKMYLRNSHAQQKHKAHKAAEVPVTTQDEPAANPGPMADSTFGENNSTDDSESNSDDEKWLVAIN